MPAFVLGVMIEKLRHEGLAAAVVVMITAQIHWAVEFGELYTCRRYGDLQTLSEPHLMGISPPNT